MKKNFLLLTTLGIILILGGFLRFVNLSSRGIFSWDEGHYTGVLYTLHAAIRYIINTFIFGKDLGEFSEYMLTYGINHYLAGKPTFFVLGLIATLFSGLHIYTLQLVSALTGLLTIAVIYYISCALGQKQIGIIAAFMLAISYFHIYYSRTALPQISSVFFAYSAVLFYIYAMRKDKLATENFCYNKFLLLAGLTIGFAFSSHYNLFWMPFVFWFSEILHYSTNLKGKPFGLKLRRFLIFSFFMALPLLGYELFLRAIKIYIYYHPQWITAISGSSGQGEFLTYFEQLKTQISQSKHFSDTANALSNKLFYIHMIFLKEGVVMFFFFITGLFYMLHLFLKKLLVPEFVLTTVFLVPFILYSSSNHIQNMRSVVVIFPAYCLISAQGFGLFYAYIMKRKRILAGAFTISIVVILFIGAAFKSREYINKKTGYEEAFKFMRENEGVKHFSSNPIITRIYAGRKNTFDIRSYYPPELKGGDVGHFSIEHIRELQSKGFNYLVLDHLRYRYSNVLIAACEAVPAVFTAFHSSDADRFEQGYEGLKYAASCPKRIEVFRINDLLNKIEGMDK